MRRRDFTTGLLLTAAAWPALAQAPAKQHRIALVSSGIPADQLTETAGPFLLRVLKTTTAKIPVVAIMSDAFALSWTENLARYRSNAPIVFFGECHGQ